MTGRARRDRASSSWLFNELMTAWENILSLLPAIFSPLASHLQTLALISSTVYNGCNTVSKWVSYNHFRQAFSHREAGSEADKQSLTHLKSWFRQSEETLMSFMLRDDQVGIQLWPHEAPHSAKMIKSKPEVLTNSRYCWGGKLRVISISNKSRKTHSIQLSQVKSCLSCVGKAGHL